MTKLSNVALLGLAAAASLGKQGSAFNLPQFQRAKQNLATKVETSVASNRRNFIESAAVVAAGVLLSPLESNAFETGGKIQFGDESIMSPKEHGTSAKPVQEDLLYGVSNKLADKICNYNRHAAERGGYFLSTSFEDVVLQSKGPVTFYDSVTGSPLFVAPIGRSAEEFIVESEVHGWPSFRDQEVRNCNCILV
jgi:hypothetical protein